MELHAENVSSGDNYPLLWKTRMSTFGFQIDFVSVVTGLSVFYSTMETLQVSSIKMDDGLVLLGGSECVHHQQQQQQLLYQDSHLHHNFS